MVTEYNKIIKKYVPKKYQKPLILWGKEKSPEIKQRAVKAILKLREGKKSGRRI